MDAFEIIDPNAKATKRRKFEGLPGYAYDPRLHNYVDIRTGKMISRNIITDALKNYLDYRSTVLESVAEKYVAGFLSKEEFFVIFSREVANGHKAAAALAKGGWHNMSQSDWGVVGHYLRDDYRNIVNFIDDIENGRYTDSEGNYQVAAILNRARAYASTSYTIYWRLFDAIQQEDPNISEEKWNAILDDVTCSRCAGLAALGWVPKGTLPNPALHPSCRCEKDYR